MGAKERRRSSNISRRTIVMIMFVSVLSAENAFGDSVISLQLEADKAEYVLREPVKFVVTIKNVSSQAVRIAGIRYLGMEMEYMYYEVVSPQGERQLRHFQPFSRITVSGKDYTGEPLEPGKSVQTVLYPAYTYSLTSPEMGFRFTFDKPGVFRVRVVYHVPEHQMALWKPLDGELHSNTLHIKIRSASLEEEEILDAIWAYGNQGGLSGPAFGDMYAEPHNETTLRWIIEKYRNHPLVKHAFLALGKSLVSDPNREKELQEAIEIFEMMKSRYPRFRFEEVRVHQGWAYWNSGDKGNAVQLAVETLKERPALRDDANFMSFALYVMCDDRSREVFKAWLQSRKNGEPFDETRFRRDD